MRLHYSGWDYGLATHVGNIKKINEDRSFLRIAAGPEKKSFVIAMIADGMGGYNSGEAASSIAVEYVKKWWDDRIPSLIKTEDFFKDVNKGLTEVFRQVNKKLLELKQKQQLNTGTTLSVLFLYGSSYLAVHVGDSRIYRVYPASGDITDFCIEQLTEDQSWVASQMKKGLLSKEEARVHPKRNILLQCLGITPELNIFHKTGRFGEEDLFLLCSDGFFSMFSDNKIMFFLTQLTVNNYSLQKISEFLVKEAVNAGARDNITVMTFRWRKNKFFRGKEYFRFFRSIIQEEKI